MNHLEETIKRLRKKHSIERLKRMFVWRTRDTLFAEVGELDENCRESQIGGHLLTWRGYELLTGLEK